MATNEVNGDLTGANKRHTESGKEIEQNFEELRISVPEKKQKLMDERQLKNVDELPGHICRDPDDKRLLDQNLVFVQEPSPEEVCVSGRHVAIKSHTVPDCGHTYCGELIAILNKQGRESFRCDGIDDDTGERCQIIVQVAQLTLDRALDKGINKKRVKCINADEGCNSIEVLRKLQKHLATDCQYEQVQCPNCHQLHKRRDSESHQSSCKSKACEFAKIGCQQITTEESHGPSTSAASSETHPHSNGLHFALIYQRLASCRAVAEFSAQTLDYAMTQHSHTLTCQEQAAHMIGNSDEQRAESDTIKELHGNYVNKRMDTRNALDKCNHRVHVEFPMKVAERTQRMRNRSQWLERQEEERNEFMEEFMKETNAAPILLNQGSMIYKLANFSELRTKAIKGEQKRGVYGPEFYTHEFGYLMVPILYPNGDGGGSGSHLSIFIAIKKGKYDSLLRWPVVGRITISILSQRRVGRETIRHSFQTDVTSLSYHRPKTEINQASGIPRALDLNLLKQPSDFLVDDTLFIQIVVDPKNVEK